MSDLWPEYTRFLIALLAVLDPFMAVPVFLAANASRDEAGRRRLARAISLTVFLVLAGAALAGEAILRALGTSLASFRIGGGLVLLLMALAMLQARVGGLPETAGIEAAGEHSPGVVPLAIPLLAGPGAISTVMIAVNQGGWHHQGVIVLIIALVCLILWSMLRLAVPIGRLLGSNGVNVANRLLGLLLTAIAVESMATGLKALFPALSGS